jgi:endonuclease-3
MPKRLSPDDAAALYARLAEAHPEPKTELNYKDPYTLLVAVILSAQATDVSVNKATRPLFEVADTPAKMVALGEKKLGSYVKTIGLWRAKSKNVIAMSRLLIERHGGRVPRAQEDLEALPGVGRKTANVVLNAAFGEKTIAVDTHVFRLANRTGLAPAKTPLEVERGLLKVTPEIYLQHAHHWLILHGRYVCLARSPKCPSCVIADICLFKEKTMSPDSERAKPPRSAARRAPQRAPTVGAARAGGGGKSAAKRARP